MSLVTWQDLCVDAVDVDIQSQFWAEVSGLEVADVEPPARLKGATRRHTVWVNPVDRPHRVKNRVHLDVDCASVQDLVTLGATVLAPSSETGFGWTVMADPEGNEFCAFERPAGELPDYGPAPDTDSADEAGKFDAFAKFVTPDVLDMPPLGKEFDLPREAAQFKVTVVDQEGFGTAANPKVQELIEVFFTGDEADGNPLVMLGDQDTVMTMQHGFDNEEAREFFIKKLTRSAHRTQMRALLEDGARYFRLSLSDTSAEMFASEYWLIAPFQNNTDKAVQIEIDYSEIF